MVKRFVSSNIAAILLAFALVAPAAAQPTVGASDLRTSAPQQGLSAIRIDNFGRVNGVYYRGAQPRGGDYAALASVGVRTVIDLTRDGDVTEPAMVRAAGMKFFRIEMTTREVPSSTQIAQFLSIVNDPANQPVYVHCQGGRHRTGVMTAIYRMTQDHWKPEKAFAEMKQYRFGADFLHPEFKQFVLAYHAPAAALAGATTAAPGKVVAAPGKQ